MANTEYNPYKEQDIENVEMPIDDGSRFGSSSLSNVKEMQIGSGTSVFRGDQSGIWLGSDKFATAPFSVDMNGNCTASSIVLTGYTTSSDVTTIIGNTVDTGYVNALNITAGSVAAEDITGTTITGKTIRTASSGQRVVMSASSNSLQIYDSTGETRMALTGELLQFYDQDGLSSGAIYADSSDLDYLYIDNSGTDGAIALNIDNTGSFSVSEDSNVRLSYLPVENKWLVEHDFVSSENGLYNLGGSSLRFDTVYCVALDESSDIRLKENIIPSKYGLEDILKMTPIMYNFKGDVPQDDSKVSKILKKGNDKRLAKKIKGMTEEEKVAYLAKRELREQAVEEDKQKRRNTKKSKVHIGFSAQDMYNIIPEVTNNASPDSEETASINKTQLIPVLVKAIQELNGIVENLKEEINTLKNNAKKL
jgi:hypothetical protein